MRDEVKKFNIDGLELPMIKGKTKIILTNVTDGSQKIIEHDNTFQSSVIAKYLRSLGAYQNSPWQNETWASRSLWRNLVGGIFLFRDAIDLTGGDVEYMPASNLMVANGSYGVSNSGNPTELGSYNSIESSTDGASSMSFVYDWGTSQGNGTISCVCLTSETGGFIGYGNASGYFRNSGLSTQSNQHTQSQNGFPYKNNNYKFVIDTTAKTLTVSKTPIATEQASIFNGAEQTAQTFSFSTAWTALDSPVIAYMGSGKAAIMKGGAYKGIANGATETFLIYDFEAKTVTEKTITNNSGKLLAITYNHKFRAVMTETALYALATTNLSANQNATDVVKISLSDSQHTIITKPETSEDLFRLTEDLLAVGGYVVDTVNETAFLSNAVENTTSSSSYHDEYDALVYVPQSSSLTENRPRTMHKNPLYLATINNLESPVTKDSTQTMKVIYTLVEA